MSLAELEGMNDSCLASGVWAGQHGLILLAGSRESNPPTPTPALIASAGQAQSGPVPKVGALGTQGGEGRGLGERRKGGVPGKSWSLPHTKMRA